MQWSDQNKCKNQQKTDAEQYNKRITRDSQPFLPSPGIFSAYSQENQQRSGNSSNSRTKDGFTVVKSPVQNNCANPAD